MDSIKKYNAWNRLRPWLGGGLLIAMLVLAGYFIYIEYIAPTPLVETKGVTDQPADASGAMKTDQQKSEYAVPPDHPRELTIQKLGINANIIPISALKDGSLDAPKTAWDVGWYEKSALPGSGSGASFIDGHVNDAIGTPGIFYKLSLLTKGDQITIERGDHTTISYVVVEIDQQAIAEVDMNKALSPLDSSKEGLTLMTCGGVYNATRKTYDDRIIVYAERDNNG